MSTLEATVSMVQKCTEEELQVVQQVIRQFFLNRGAQTTTKSQFLEELVISRKQHQNGQCQEADAALGIGRMEGKIWTICISNKFLEAFFITNASKKITKQISSACFL